MFIAAIAETRLHMLHREYGPASGLGYGPSHGEEQLSPDLQEFLPTNASVI